MPSTATKKVKTPRTSPKKPANSPLPVVSIPIDKIDPSPFNRDAKLDLAPLVASIKAHGLQQAIKLRPRGDRYEIVYGERRWRACSALGYPDIPAVIEDLDDARAAELRVLENLQRTDPHALEEAEEYERLLGLKDSKGKPIHTPESIAKLSGRSTGHVYNRLALTALAPELRKALYKGELLLTAAFRIARHIPTELQAEAWEKLKTYGEEECLEEELDDDGRLSVRAVQSFIDAEYASRLDNAPFSTKDAKLLPAAGACQGCAKRSGNQPHLFAAADPKDTCLDLKCFHSKVDAYVGREKQRILDVGGKVLSDDESRRIFNGGSTLSWNSKWVDLDGPCFEDPKRRTWRQLLGDLRPAPVLAFTSQAKPVQLGDRAAITSTLKAHGLDPESLRAKADAKRKPTSAPAAGTPVPAADARAHPDDPDADEDLDADDSPAADAGDVSDPRFEAKRIRMTRQRIMTTIVSTAEAAGADDNRFAQLVYESMTRGGYHDSTIATVKRRVPGKPPKGEHPSTTLEKHAQTLGPTALRALVLELAIGRSAYYTSHTDKYPRDLQRAIELYKVPATEIEKVVSDELGAARAARLAGAKPGGA